jgi:hypothetical protein
LNIAHLKGSLTSPGYFKPNKTLPIIQQQARDMKVVNRAGYGDEQGTVAGWELAAKVP